MLSTIAKAIGLLIAAVVIFIAFIAVWVYVLIAMVGVFGLFALLWIFDAPFTVKQDGVKVGTYTRKGGFRKL